MKEKDTQIEREKHLIARIVSGNIFKKYRHQRLLQNHLASPKRDIQIWKDLLKNQKRRGSWKSLEIGRRVRLFFLLDGDIVKQTPDSKQTRLKTNNHMAKTENAKIQKRHARKSAQKMVVCGVWSIVLCNFL